MQPDADTTHAHRSHVQCCLDRADASGDAGAAALLQRRDVAALREAAVLDVLRDDGAEPSALAGLTLTVKACFDVAGWVTHAGSRVLADQTPPAVDAPAVATLRRAGAVLIAQTNMTEFAYGALGLNDTYGTPINPLFPSEPGDVRVSGGSTSGGAVAVALGIADISLGSDTSGSVRIPAAFCGVAAFKPSRGRYPDAAMVYLSPTFDVPGIVAASAEMCRRIDAVLVNDGPVNGGLADDVSLNAVTTASVRGRRLIVPDDITFGVDPMIATVFNTWVATLVEAGVEIILMPMPGLAEAGIVARKAGIISAEAYMLHRDRLQSRGHLYDPRVGSRIAAGVDVRAHDYAAGLARLRVLSQGYDADLDRVRADAVLTPTVGILPPRIADLYDNDAYLTANAQAFRLTEFANRLDLPSITLPGSLTQRRPIGLLLTGRRGGDADLLDLAVRIERFLTDS